MFVYLCVCVFVYRHVCWWCVGGCTTDMLIQRQGKGEDSHV